MSEFVVTRRLALLGLGAFAVVGLAGCNTPQTGGPAATPAAVGSQPVSGYVISNIVVDASPLLAVTGNPTAQWVQDSLPGALAKALASHYAPGAANGATLSVTVNSLSLGQGGPADPDTIQGVATLSGGAGAARNTPVMATSTWVPSPVDDTLVEQSTKARVNGLTTNFAYWLARKWRR